LRSLPEIVRIAIAIRCGTDRVVHESVVWIIVEELRFEGYGRGVMIWELL